MERVPIETRACRTRRAGPSQDGVIRNTVHRGSQFLVQGGLSRSKVQGPRSIWLFVWLFVCFACLILSLADSLIRVMSAIITRIGLLNSR